MLPDDSLPTLDDADAISIDTAQLIAHTLVQANSGGGKTVAIRRILEQTWGAMPQWMIDPEGEMHTLRERMPLLLAAPHGGDTVASVKTAPLLVRKLLETGASIVIDIYDMGVDERHAFVKAFAEAAMNQPRALWRDILVAVDEAHRYIPERGEDPSEATGAMKNWLTAGRKRGYAILLAVQRLSTLHKSAAAECNNRLIGRTGLDTDQERAGKALGLRRPEDREALARLKPGRFWVYGPAFCERPTEVQIGEILTSHGRAARGKPPTPPLDEARRVLAAIGDLPAEAEAELKTVEQLKARVRELEARDYSKPDLDNRLAEIASERDTVKARLERAVVVALEERDEAHKQLDRVKAGYRVQHAAFSQATPIIERIKNDVAHLAKVIVVDHLLWSEVAPPGNGPLEKMQEISFKSGGVSNPDGDHPTIPGSVATIYQSAESPAANRFRADLAPMQRRLLTVLAQHGRLPKGKVLVHARYAAGGQVSRCWAQMTRDGWITSDEGIVEITTKGLGALGAYEPLPTGGALLAAVLPRLSQMEQRLLQVCVDAFPDGISKGAVLKKSGYAAGGQVSRAWAHLCALDYLTSNRGHVTAAKELCIP